jgi:hypothetical protein
MSQPWRVLLTLLVASTFCSRRKVPRPQATLANYIAAANRHDLHAVRAMTAEKATWQLGPTTLRGPDEMLAPLAFDQGAHTVLEASNIVVTGDTVDFDLLERNDVLRAYGIPALHHSPRMILRKGQIYRITVRRPPLEQKDFVDTVAAFRRWFQAQRPDLYEQFYPGGRFNYARSTGEGLPKAIAAWKRSRN